jgi:hypothetical protein
MQGLDVEHIARREGAVAVQSLMDCLTRQQDHQLAEIVLVRGETLLADMESLNAEP